MAKTINVLAVNAGSSSIKLGLFTVDEQQISRVATVTISGLGQASPSLRTTDAGGGETARMVEAASHTEALAIALETIDVPMIDAVAYRLVHGGMTFHEPCRITDDTIAALQAVAVFDPDHTPAALEIIAALRDRMPGACHIASFDTALFHDLPTVARLTTLPRKYEQLGLRRYGFHGLSYEYLLDEFAHIAGEAAAQGRVIVAHLGSGVSLAAFRGGKPIDVSMGFSPASGVLMSTRSGDIDPGIVTFLRAQGVEGAEFDEMINRQSGLLGVSDLSADMLTLLQQESNNPQAREAVTLFCYQVRKTIGAFAAALGGVDSIIFAGGIGEQSPVIRARICENLGYLGVDIDDEPNGRHATLISSAVSKVGVHVIPTDEAKVLCKHAYQLVIPTEK